MLFAPIWASLNGSDCNGGFLLAAYAAKGLVMYPTVDDESRL
jgi:hypothetical protein